MTLHVSGLRILGLRKSGRGDWIRTNDLSVPNRALYQAEPRPEMKPYDSRAFVLLSKESVDNSLVF